MDAVHATALAEDIILLILRCFAKRSLEGRTCADPAPIAELRPHLRSFPRKREPGSSRSRPAQSGSPLARGRAVGGFRTGGTPQSSRSPPASASHDLHELPPRHRRRRHRDRHLGHAGEVDERLRPRRDGRARGDRRRDQDERRDQGRGDHLRQGGVLRRRRPQHARPHARRIPRRGRGRASRRSGAAALSGDVPPRRSVPASSRPAASRWSPRSTAPASAAPSSWRSVATGGSPPTATRCGWGCPRCGSGSCPAPAGRSGWRGWSTPRMR